MDWNRWALSRSYGALQMAEVAPLDGAVLDIRLRDGFTFAAYRALVPFVFLTGVMPEGLPIEFRAALAVAKLFEPESLVIAVRTILEVGPRFGFGPYSSTYGPATHVPCRTTQSTSSRQALSASGQQCDRGRLTGSR